MKVCSPRFTLTALHRFPVSSNFTILARNARMSSCSALVSFSRFTMHAFFHCSLTDEPVTQSSPELFRSRFTSDPFEIDSSVTGIPRIAKRRRLWLRETKGYLETGNCSFYFRRVRDVAHVSHATCPALFLWLHCPPDLRYMHHKSRHVQGVWASDPFQELRRKVSGGPNRLVPWVL